MTTHCPCVDKIIYLAENYNVSVDYSNTIIHLTTLSIEADAECVLLDLPTGVRRIDYNDLEKQRLILRNWVNANRHQSWMLFDPANETFMTNHSVPTYSFTININQ